MPRRIFMAAMRASCLAPVIFFGSCGAERASESSAAPLAERPADAERLDELLGWILEERFAEAQVELERLLAEREGLGRAELYLGMCFQKQKHYGRALPLFEAVTERAEGFAGRESAWYYLGWCRYHLGDVDGAGTAFEEHLALDPDEGDSHFGLGLVALEGGRLDAAVEHLERSIELHRAVEEAGVDRAREVAKAYARLADVHVAREQWAEARDDLTTCVALHPPHHEAWYKLSQVLLELGEERASAEALRQHDLWKARRPMTAAERAAANAE